MWIIIIIGINYICFISYSICDCLNNSCIVSICISIIEYFQRYNFNILIYFYYFYRVVFFSFNSFSNVSFMIMIVYCIVIIIIVILLEIMNIIY